MRMSSDHVRWSAGADYSSSLSDAYFQRGGSVCRVYVHSKIVREAHFICTEPREDDCSFVHLPLAIYLDTTLKSATIKNSVVGCVLDVALQ